MPNRTRRSSFPDTVRPATARAATARAPGLRSRLAAGGFAVTAEIGPPRSADPGVVTRKAEALRGWVDAANITDNPGARARLASWAGSLLALAAGVEPIMQLTCRDRNRIALQSDLLSASALGVRNVLLMTGDDPKAGDDPGAMPVFDLDAVQLISAARAMRDEGRLLSGRTVDPPPDWLIGAVENPFAPSDGSRAGRLGKKIDAGAEFVQTQFVFDLAAFARWLSEVRDAGLDERCRILAGVGPIRSLRALDHMTNNVPGLHIPAEIGRRLRGVPGDRVAAEGLRMCAEIIQQVREIPGVSGIHVMAPGFEQGIPDILASAGIQRRDHAERASAGLAWAQRRDPLVRGSVERGPVERGPVEPDGAAPARAHPETAARREPRPLAERSRRAH